MCDSREQGSIEATVQNLRQPVPLRDKIKLITRNNWRKLRTRSDCCGNYGEPGC